MRKSKTIIAAERQQIRTTESNKLLVKLFSFWYKKCISVLRPPVMQIHWQIQIILSLHWRHNEHDGVSNHQPNDCLLNRLFRRRSKKTPKLRVTSICAGNSLVIGEFPAQRASNAENISIWWRHHENCKHQNPKYIPPLIYNKFSVIVKLSLNFVLVCRKIW